MEISIPSTLTAEQALFALLRAYKDAPFIGALWSASNDFTAQAQWPEAYQTLDWIIGIGISVEDEDAEPSTLGKKFTFHDFESMHKARPEFRLGYFAYEMKEHVLGDTPNLNSAMGGQQHAFWFRPSLLIICKQSKISIPTDHHNQFDIVNNILNGNMISENLQNIHKLDQSPITGLPTPKLGDIMQCETTFEEYTQRINQIRQEIQSGTFYELNYCIEWTGKHKVNNTLDLWRSLCANNGSPFASYLKNRNIYILGNSPERFLKIQESQIISQPIKGTAPRSPDPILDKAWADELSRNPKDKAEHIMIVDLVRNDLVQCCDPLSVHVTDLSRVYSFRTVHQMISTVRATIPQNQSLANILTACFPMGSMTGAPKAMVCRWIDHLEKKKRGIYSGSIGYIDENGNMDLNVVIRSLIYDDAEETLSLTTGGAITWDSEAKNEWMECQTKAKAILETKLVG